MLGSCSFDYAESGSSSSRVNGDDSDGDSRGYAFDYFFDRVPSDDIVYAGHPSSDVATSTVSSSGATSLESERFVVTISEVEDVVC